LSAEPDRTSVSEAEPADGSLLPRRRRFRVHRYPGHASRCGDAPLRESEERLRFALDSGRLGFWQHDLATGALFCSDHCRAHFGRGPDEPITHEEILAAVHADDRDRATEAIRDAVRSGRPYDLEYRVVWPDGSVRWLMVRGRANYDTFGHPLRTFGITLDITERKEAEARQAAVEESLRDAARRKDEFLAMLAHELRNPLSPVASAIEIMRARPDRELDERARGVVERQLGHMSRLIDDLLDVSRINTGKITLRNERLDLRVTVQRAVESVRTFVAGFEHTMTVELPTCPVYLDADPVRLEQVITNLLHNAAKYTDPGGRIRITLESLDGFANIRVHDNGIGITPDLLGQVFDLFTQGERGLDRSQGGLGLGLTLVRSLVRLHGGTVEAHSEGPGRGSEFVVTLPVPKDEGVPTGIRMNGRMRDEGERCDPSSVMRHAPTAGTHPSSPIPEPLKRVLVVDDIPDSAETLAELARIWGFEVATEYDGLGALRRADEWLPHFVFLDIGMPGLDGYEVAQRLRRDYRFTKTFLVALTGYGRPEDVARSRAAGFDHHLVKPVDVRQVEGLLRQAPSPVEAAAG
jgi:PAS domain S-box-containing protein